MDTKEVITEKDIIINITLRELEQARHRVELLTQLNHINEQLAEIENRQAKGKAIALLIVNSMVVIGLCYILWGGA